MLNKPVVLIDKKIGETPLAAISKFRVDNPNYKEEKMAYAGRLDPMARGLLICLVGDECKNRDKYQCLDKTYEFEILFGVGTDTSDIL